MDLSKRDLKESHGIDGTLKGSRKLQDEVGQKNILLKWYTLIVMLKVIHLLRYCEEASSIIIVFILIFVIWILLLYLFNAI